MNGYKLEFVSPLLLVSRVRRPIRPARTSGDKLVRIDGTGMPRQDTALSNFELCLFDGTIYDRDMCCPASSRLGAEACDWRLENLLLEFPRPPRIVGLAEYVITVNVHRQQQSADCERCRRMLLFTRQKLPLLSLAYTL